MDEPIPQRRGVRFGHEEYKEMEPTGGTRLDPFLTRRPARIEEEGILGPDTQLHPAYAQRKHEFEARAASKYQGDDEPSEGAQFGEDFEMEAELAADKQRANAAAASATAAAGIQPYGADKGSRARVAALVNEREGYSQTPGQGQGVESFEDLFADIEKQKQSRPAEGTPWRENLAPGARVIPTPAKTTDSGAHEWRRLQRAASLWRGPSPGLRAAVLGGSKTGFLKPTKASLHYGEGKNAEKHPVGYYPNSAWAAAPIGAAPTGMVGAGQSQPAQRARRSDKVMGQYWRTFKERSAAGAGFFGALFGGGMRRANDRVAEADRQRSLASLSEAGMNAPKVKPLGQGLDLEVGNRRNRMWRKANRFASGSGFTAPDYEENLAFKAEQLGYTMEGKVGGSVPEASLDDEDADD